MIAPEAPDLAALKRAYGAFPTGVTAVCAVRGGDPVGMVASSFVAVSLQPPLVAVCVQHTSTTWPRLASLPRLGVSVLSSRQSRACQQFAAKTGNRFDGLEYTITAEGTVLLHEAAAWLDCSLYAIVTAGDHDVVLLRVQAVNVAEADPLIYHGSRFHALAPEPV